VAKPLALILVTKARSLASLPWWQRRNIGHTIPLEPGAKPHVPVSQADSQGAG